jgi:phosphoribosylformylglycinamidine (FGAM) synthase-like amidotransferase family enzyme
MVKRSLSYLLDDPSQPLIGVCNACRKHFVANFLKGNMLLELIDEEFEAHDCRDFHDIGAKLYP